MRDDFTLFCGSASPLLGARIAQLLGQSPGMSVVERFPDGEVNIHLEEPVRGREVYIVQSTCPPVDQNLIELLAMADACRRAAATRITAVIPYFGYGRADKRNGQRAPVTGSMVATLLESVGITHVVTVDLHAPQIEGFFRIPVDSLTSVPTLCNVVQHSLSSDCVVVSPDEGRVKMAAEFARLLRMPVAVLHKERRSATSTRVTHVIGDIHDRHCLIIDDMISTGGTMVEAAEALLKAGARPGIRVAATHGLFAANARERLDGPPFEQFVVCDSVPVADAHSARVKCVSLAPLLAGAIYRFRSGKSLADLYQHAVHGGVDELLQRWPSESL